jgi:hypothetical protein
MMTYSIRPEVIKELVQLIRTVTLRGVRSDKKGSLESETVKYGRESQGTRTQERLRWQGSAAYTKDRPVLSSERAPQINNCATV